MSLPSASRSTTAFVSLLETMTSMRAGYRTSTLVVGTKLVPGVTIGPVTSGHVLCGTPPDPQAWHRQSRQKERRHVAVCRAPRRLATRTEV
ncbi:MAG: hypothetical protein ACM3O7_05640 [Acidobacteriota bacterium]